MTHLECTRCGAAYEAQRLWRLSPCCEKPLYARYDLAGLAGTFTPDAVRCREATLWRYAEVLPVADPANRLTLGEGWTPLLPAPRLAERLGLRAPDTAGTPGGKADPAAAGAAGADGTAAVPRGGLWLKDEGQNPTGSFKARGLVMAVARARELGVRAVALPSAGNAGAAAAAYAAAANLECHVVVPKDTPRVIVEETRALGAHVELIDGLITDAGARVAQGAQEHGWFDLSTLKEPYRVEGKKTMGYELFEQLGGRLPDVIIYPTGGGTGLVGMWKAFDEMEQLGWIGSDRPRMISVQASGCAPIVRAYEQGADSAEPWQDAHTYASGLRVPRAVGDFLILGAVRASGGTAIAVSDEAMAEAVLWIGADTGVFAAPEGGAVAAAVPMLLAQGTITSEDEVVLFITGSGLKYVV
jgi:threonine synthase